MTWPIWMTLTACVGLLIAEHRQSTSLKWATKPIAALGFVLLALERGAMDSSYGLTLLAGLILCMLGDLLLIPDHKKSFLGGIGAFLLGHVLFAVAFFARGTDTTAVLASALPLCAIGLLVYRWLSPHLEGFMQKAVIAYILAIMTMVAGAIGTTMLTGSAASAITIGAIGFMISDLSVARDRFVTPGFVNRIWGAPLYFIAQLILATTASLGLST